MKRTLLRLLPLVAVVGCGGMIDTEMAGGAQSASSPIGLNGSGFFRPDIGACMRAGPTNAVGAFIFYTPCNPAQSLGHFRAKNVLVGGLGDFTQHFALVFDDPSHNKCLTAPINGSGNAATLQPCNPTFSALQTFDYDYGTLYVQDGTFRCMHDSGVFNAQVGSDAYSFSAAACQSKEASANIVPWGFPTFVATQDVVGGFPQYWASDQFSPPSRLVEQPASTTVIDGVTQPTDGHQHILVFPQAFFGGSPGAVLSTAAAGSVSVPCDYGSCNSVMVETPSNGLTHPGFISFGPYVGSANQQFFFPRVTLPAGIDSHAAFSLQNNTGGDCVYGTGVQGAAMATRGCGFNGASETAHMRIGANL